MILMKWFEATQFYLKSIVKLFTFIKKIVNCEYKNWIYNSIKW